MHCLPCTASRVAPAEQAPVVGLCPSCQGALCLTHWNEQQLADGPGGMRLACRHTGVVTAVPQGAPRATSTAA